jgi:hypothetical protein
MVNSLWLKYKIETKLMFVMVTIRSTAYVYRYLRLGIFIYYINLFKKSGL